MTSPLPPGPPAPWPGAPGPTPPVTIPLAPPLPPAGYTPAPAAGYAPPPGMAPVVYHVHIQAPPPAPPGYVPVGVIPRAGTSNLATCSLILGIIGLLSVCPATVWITALTAIPAIILGHVALGRIRRAPGILTGRGLAIAGFILGYLGIAVILAYIALFAITHGAAHTPGR